MPPATAIEYKDKFIAFIDILGFKQFVEQSSQSDGMALAEILALLEVFGKPQERMLFDQYGPTICPFSRFVEKNLDFRLTQISDCVIVSSEVSPAGVINLLSHCTTVVTRFLLKGVMCRGYVTRGPVYHTETQIVGTGYQAAYQGETGVTAFKKEADEHGTPFVEIDRSVVEYVSSSTDDCVREMYRRMVKRDGDVSAIFPFDRLSHSFAIGGFGVKFDPDKERHANDVVRSDICTIKKRVEARIDNTAHPSATEKARHYLAMLDEQLAICDATDEIISALSKPFPSPH
jgi:hypothetical protein